MPRPTLIDVCCCAGGASMGYYQAGFDVLGVDKDPQPNYPFPFIQADVTKLDLDSLIEETGAVFLHGSPPCQLFTTLNQGNKARQKPAGSGEHVDLIPVVREKFEATGLPYIIENVPQAPVRKDIQLCGEMFGLSVIRHRNFELGHWSAPQPEHIKHRGRVRGYNHGVLYDGPYFPVYGDGGDKGTIAEWQEAMGIDWTDVRKEIAEAIPPAYAAYLGGHAITHVGSQQVAA